LIYFTPSFPVQKSIKNEEKNFPSLNNLIRIYIVEWESAIHKKVFLLKRMKGRKLKVIFAELTFLYK